MRVTVDVKGEGTHEIDLESLTGDASDGAREPTYADIVSTLALSPHEVTVLVDGRPVPEDQPVDATEITVLRLIKGG